LREQRSLSAFNASSSAREKKEMDILQMMKLFGMLKWQ
jgi:hypothetical protein